MNIVKCKVEIFKCKILKLIFCLKDLGGFMINRCVFCLIKM